MSGMGTTLAMYGAYNLAGGITRYPNDPVSAFAVFEDKMRPSVNQAQKLIPGMFRIMSPKTAWGVWIIDTLISVLVWSRLVNLLMMLKGPKKNTLLVEEYGFKELPDWIEETDEKFEDGPVLLKGARAAIVT